MDVKRVYLSLEFLLRSLKFLNKSFSISQPVLDLPFVIPDKNMSRENLITYKECMISLIC